MLKEEKQPLVQLQRRTTNRLLESLGLYADGNTPRLFSPHLKHKGYESNY